MSGVSGIVKAVIGQVFAVSPDGSKRLLTEGDRILDGEQVQTGPTGAISLSLADGKQVDLGRDSHWDSSGHVATDATAAQQQDIAAIQQAIADGQDPTQTLEAPAAGPQPGNSGGEPGGSGGGSHTHVVLDLTAEVVDPNAGYPTIGLDFPDDERPEEITLLDTDDSDADADADA
ncbi:retention module-containing protein, partial [Leclercia adecarboxylata]|uniref:retention module-containing protein n=4 Tax=Leclercia adecarboxylata TaxID=83655 RepID=UPI003B433B45